MDKPKQIATPLSCNECVFEKHAKEEVFDIDDKFCSTVLEHKESENKDTNALYY